MKTCVKIFIVKIVKKMNSQLSTFVLAAIAISTCEGVHSPQEHVFKDHMIDDGNFAQGMKDPSSSVMNRNESAQSAKIVKNCEMACELIHNTCFFSPITECSIVTRQAMADALKTPHADQFSLTSVIKGSNCSNCNKISISTSIDTCSF